LNHSFQLLLLQIAVILVMARVCGLLVRLAGQPQVIGEMLAGILLGPSVLGRLNGGQILGSLFPPDSRGHLDMLSQVGVVLFMFLVGLELDLGRVVRQGLSVLRVAAASMIIPFAAGIALAVGLQQAGFGHSPRGNELSFALFVATALSITAFPVLARILKDAGQTHSRVGMTAISCAALNDVAGWCLLAVVLALFRAGSAQAGWTGFGELWPPIVGVLVYTAVMIFLVRPVLRQFQLRFEIDGRLSSEMLATLFILLALSSFATDWVGIHALFGAFMLGVIMPSEPRLVQYLTAKLEGVATLFLLPLYFAYTGLRTDMGLLNSPAAWGMAVIVTLVAIVSKVGGTYAAARFERLSHRDSFTLGILLNTRGLMELVILNIALEAQAISVEVFSMFIVMTLVTTIMTSPLMYALMTRPSELPVPASPCG
jgi:Kef-type K+ transport system membrane component KefB